MKISFVPYRQIDKQKWDVAIHGAPQSRIYALSWYLDAVTNNAWDALVTDDYASVMPLPRKSFFPGLAIVYQPVITQQLGVFGRNANAGEVQQFLLAIPQQFGEVALSLNSENLISQCPGFDFTSKTNLELSLNKPYEEIQKGFQKGVRSAIRKGVDQLELKLTDDVAAHIDFYKQVMQVRLQLKPSAYIQIQSVLQLMLDKNLGFIVKATSKTGEVVAMNFFAQYQNRIVNLFGTSNEAGKKLEAMHNIIHFAIQMHAGQDVILDFEGSDIPPVKAFFQSFGAEDKPYFACVRQRKSGLLTLIRRLQGKL